MSRHLHPCEWYQMNISYDKTLGQPKVWIIGNSVYGQNQRTRDASDIIRSNGNDGLRLTVDIWPFAWCKPLYPCIEAAQVRWAIGRMKQHNLEEGE
jgi:hypothetical protein